MQGYLLRLLLLLDQGHIAVTQVNGISDDQEQGELFSEQ
jgi:hypothetical protein